MTNFPLSISPSIQYTLLYLKPGLTILFYLYYFVSARGDHEQCEELWSEDIQCHCYFSFFGELTSQQVSLPFYRLVFIFCNPCSELSHWNFDLLLLGSYTRFSFFLFLLSIFDTTFIIFFLGWTPRSQEPFSSRPWVRVRGVWVAPYQQICTPYRCIQISYSHSARLFLQILR